MTLVLTLIVSAVVLVALFWVGSLVLQGWLYNVPVDRLPLRASAAGAAMALFLTLWCWLDARNPGRYDTLFNFSSLDSEDYDEVEAVRLNPRTGEETVVPYRRRPGLHGSEAFSDARPGATGNPFRRSDTETLVVAIIVKDKQTGQPTRFNAELTVVDNEREKRLIEQKTAGMSDADKAKAAAAIQSNPPDAVKTKINAEQFKPDRYSKPQFAESARESLRFVAADGRYIDAANIGRVYRPRPSVFLANVFLNLFHFAMWLALLWLVLRFTFGHALGFAFAAWVFVTLAVLPIMFNQNRPAAARSAERGANEMMAKYDVPARSASDGSGIFPSPRAGEGQGGG